MSNPILTLADKTADDVDLAASPDGTELWIAWSAATLAEERVRLARLRAGDAAPAVLPVRLVDAPGSGGDASHAFRPRVCVVGDDVVLAAAVVLEDGRTRLDVVRLERATGRTRETWFSDEPGASIFDIALAPHPSEPGAVWLACDVRQGRRSTLRLGILSPGGLWRDVALPRSPGLVPWRRTPALATGGGHTWLAWVEGADVRTGPGHVHLALLTPDATVALVTRPDPHPAHQEAPAVTVTRAGEAVVAWHTGAAAGARDDDPMHWLRAWQLTPDGHAHPLPTPPRPEPTRDTCGEDQGWEFPTLAVDEDDTITLVGRSAHGFHATRLTADACTERIALSKPGWGGRGRRSALAHFDGHLVFGRREPDGVSISQISQISQIRQISPAHPLLRAVREAFPSPAERGAVDDRAQPTSTAPLPALQGGSACATTGLSPGRSACATTGLSPGRSACATTGLIDGNGLAKQDQGVGRPGESSIYFGDLHQHSVHSDAMGAPEEIVRAARDRYGHDFTALTDHELFCRRAIGPATWAFQRHVADAFDEPGRFVVLHAYEFTGSRLPGPGHKCVYFWPGRVPDRLPDKDIVELQRMLYTHGAIALPHHLGFTGADVDHHDPDLQPCFEICSVHGVYERDDLATAFPPRDDVHLAGQSIADCLNAGLRFGFVGGTDSHGLLWHHGVSPRRDPWRCGLTAVVDADLSREGILQALIDRRCYATTGACIELDVRLDDTHPMGSWLPPGTRGRLTIRVAGTDVLESVTLVTHEGESSLLVDDRECDSTRDVDLGAEGWVYVRVTQRDGEMAWSSPIAAVW